MAENYLLISDLQIPFEHEKALSFCKYLQKNFKIPKENVLCLGDEVDEYFAGLYEHDPDATHTPLSEIKESIDKIKEWSGAFPIMRIATSNHGERWKRKAFKSGIPSIMMRRYQEVLETPASWAWEERWLVETKHPFLIEHGDRFGTQYPHVQGMLNLNVSLAIGHHHSIAGIEHINTPGYEIWGACGGSLIDFNKYAFHYARKGKRIPKIGTLVVLDDGKLPIWLPLE